MTRKTSWGAREKGKVIEKIWPIYFSKICRIKRKQQKKVLQESLLEEPI